MESCFCPKATLFLSLGTSFGSVGVLPGSAPSPPGGPDSVLEIYSKIRQKKWFLLKFWTKFAKTTLGL